MPHVVLCNIVVVKAGNKKEIEKLFFNYLYSIVGLVKLVEGVYWLNFYYYHYLCLALK